MAKPKQFSVMLLFRVTASVAVALASIVWVLNSTMIGTPEDIPFVYTVGAPLMSLGLFVAPFVALANLFAVASASLTDRYFGFSAPVFFVVSFLALLVVVYPQFWQFGYRTLFAMTIAALATQVEAIFHKQWVFAWLPIITPMMLYWYLASAVCCMAV